MAVSQPSIRRWTTKHVAKWLKEEGFSDYVDLLCNRHRLDGTSILTLTEYDLRSPPLELKVLGDIKRLMVSIRKLQKQNSDVLEELGYTYEGWLSGSGAHSPNSIQGSDWLYNGDPARDSDEPVVSLSADQYHQYTNGKYKQHTRRLDPEYWKTILSSVYVVFVFGFTSFVMVIVHERVPDMQTYPPLPDIFLDSVPRIPWAFAMAEACGVVLCNIWLLVLLLHKHRILSTLQEEWLFLHHTVIWVNPQETFSTKVMEFTTSGSSNTDTSKVIGSLDTKYKWSEHGLTFTEKWNTDNTLGTEITVEDQIAKGLKLTFDTTFSPNTGKKSGKVKTAYKREFVNLGCDVDFDFAGPAIHGAAVVGYEGWLAGYQMTFDTAKSKMTQNNFSVGYKTGDFQLHTNV
ncbi:UNVERIFIED_CONTAM: hypothetical protein FKN15_029715 [Acipenser sinensis]